jgi:hypothetical protein
VLQRGILSCQKSYHQKYIYIYIYIYTHTVSGGVKTFKTFMHVAIAKENTTNESKLKFVGVIGT